MLVSVVAWGLKLEGELNHVRDKVYEVDVQISKGVLPRAEERIRYLERRLDELERDIERDHRD